VPAKNDPKARIPVIRGGSFTDSDLRIIQRSAFRQPTTQLIDVGFRIVMDREPPEVEPHP
jgi:formylglycine-generating enzyme required for sulfatase activity